MAGKDPGEQEFRGLGGKKDDRMINTPERINKEDNGNTDHFL